MFTNWSNKDIIFGNRGMQVSSNIIVLLAKRHMYRCKVRNGLLSLNLFQSELKRYILSEKCYVSAFGTMIKFTKKGIVSQHCGGRNNRRLLFKLY